jgi:hypothetical protein
MFKYLGSIFRHGLTAIGGALIAHGYAIGNTDPQFIGFILALAGLIHSLVLKYQAIKKAAIQTSYSTSAVRKIPILFALFALMFFSFGFSGCSSTSQQTAYRVTATTAVGVDVAMTAWGNYVATAHPGTHAELAVKAAYEKYQASMAAVTDAGAISAAANGTNAAASSALDLAQAQSAQDLVDLENLITSFGVKLQ